MSALLRYRWPVLVLIGAALVAGAVISQRSGRPARSAITRTLGPTAGPNADGYIAAKRAYLDRVASREGSWPAAGLVSLARFLKGSEIAGEMGPARIDLVFVRFPGQDPAVLAARGSAAAAVSAKEAEVASQLGSEATHLRKQAQGAPAGQRTALLQQAADREARGAAVRGDCACVYGLLVGGTTLRALDVLQARPAVRLADVTDPPLADLRGWELWPVLPKA